MVGFYLLSCVLWKKITNKIFIYETITDITLHGCRHRKHQRFGSNATR